MHQGIGQKEGQQFIRQRNSRYQSDNIRRGRVHKHYVFLTQDDDHTIIPNRITMGRKERFKILEDYYERIDKEKIRVYRQIENNTKKRGQKDNRIKETNIQVKEQVVQRQDTTQNDSELMEQLKVRIISDSEAKRTPERGIVKARPKKMREMLMSELYNSQQYITLRKQIILKVPMEINDQQNQNNEREQYRN